MERKRRKGVVHKSPLGCLVSLIGHHTIIIFFRVSGFVAGDDGFSIGNRKNSGQIYFRFHIAQHSKDLELMQLFVKFFCCGKVDVRSNKSTPRCDFIIQDTSFLLDKVVGHFDLYPLHNLKHEDYLCFKQALLLIKEKRHLTREGLDKIKSLNLFKILNSNIQSNSQYFKTSSLKDQLLN